MEGEKITAGAIWLLFMIILFLCFVISMSFQNFTGLDASIGRQVVKHRVFVVDIDTAMTDSLYGKVWRSK